MGSNPILDKKLFSPLRLVFGPQSVLAQMIRLGPHHLRKYILHFELPNRRKFPAGQNQKRSRGRRPPIAIGHLWQVFRGFPRSNIPSPPVGVDADDGGPTREVPEPEQGPQGAVSPEPLLRLRSLLLPSRMPDTECSLPPP
jgi:hypothetical protein